MEKFVEQAEKEGISRQIIYDMIARDIAEKEKFNKIVKWIKWRQIITIVFGSILTIGEFLILFNIIHNLAVTNDIVNTLLTGFNALNKLP